MANDLDVGATRTGFITLKVGNHLTASLHRTADGVEMVLPLRRQGFHRDLIDALEADDRTAWPDSAGFVDAHGHIALVGCHPRSHQRGLSTGVDRSRWTVDFAVMGAADPVAYAT